MRKPPVPVEVLNIVHRVLSGHVDAAPLEVAEYSEHAFDREQLRLMGDQLSATTEDLRLANARLRALINIGLDFASQRDTDRRLRELCEATHDIFGATYATVGLLTAADHQLHRLVASGTGDVSWIAEGDPLSGVFATVVNERRSVRGTLAPTDAPAEPFSERPPDVHAFLIVPLASTAQVHGWICLVHDHGARFSDEAEQQLLALAGQVGRIYELEHEVNERTLAENALRESEQLNRSLLEHLPHRIAIRDQHSVMLYCNANFSRDARHLDTPERAAVDHEEDQEVLGTGVMRHSEGPCEIDGSLRWIHTLKVPYRDTSGSVTGVLTVIDDITEQRAREQQYQQAEKMEAVGRLAGGVAHDFNNLLTAILGYCELIAGDLDPDDALRADLREIETAGQRAAGLTRQLLAFSRKEIITPVTLDLNVVVADMRTMLERLIREDVKVTLSLTADQALIEADRGQVEQIVLNLALNARDAMPGGGALSIETAVVDLDDDYATTHSSVVAGAHIALIVTDTGEGMAADVQARIFEPFFTTKPVGQGTGLGLASVQGIVARSGGSVSVYSEPGKGTAFRIYFPRATSLPTDAPTVDVTPLRGTETVLVVDDAEALRHLARRLLARQGYTVLLASNAGEALQLFERHSTIDVLLTDVVMPDGSGPTLADQLTARRPSLRVLYMSGYTEDAIVRHGVLAPEVAFLPKPFTADTLGRSIRRVLASSTQADSRHGLHEPEDAQQPPDHGNHDHHVEDRLDRRRHGNEPVDQPQDDADDDEGDNDVE